MFNQQDYLHAFPSQEKDEVLYVFARPFWLVFLPVTLVFIFVFIASVFVQYLLANGVIVTGQATNGLGILGIGIFQLFMLVVFMVSALDFYFDILIVTDRRLVEINQGQLFYRNVAMLDLESIEDVSSETKGFLQTLFDYGNLQVQTAGEQRNFLVNNIRHADDIASIIASLSEQAKDKVPENERIPDSQYIGEIEGRLIPEIGVLQQVGAMLPSDMRRQNRNAS